MAKVTRILALLTIVALVAALPMSVLAQNDAPHIFIGTAIVNGLTATTGVPITAWDGDTQIGSTTVTAGGKFNLSVNRSSGRITFKIDNVNAAQSHPAWEFGGLETGFNLTATSQSAPPGAAGPRRAAGAAGPAGARGAQGPAGAAGATGAPEPPAKADRAVPSAPRVKPVPPVLPVPPARLALPARMALLGRPVVPEPPEPLPAAAWPS